MSDEIKPTDDKPTDDTKPTNDKPFDPLNGTFKMSERYITLVNGVAVDIKDRPTLNARVWALAQEAAANLPEDRRPSDEIAVPLTPRVRAAVPGVSVPVASTPVVPPVAGFTLLTDNRKKWLAWALIALVSTLITRYLGVSVPVPVVPDVPVFESLTGWIPDPEAVEAIKETLETPLFRDTPAGKSVRGNDDDVPLWKAAIKVTGKMLPSGNQGQVGSCVSFGTGTAIDYLQCVSISQGGNLEYIRTCKEQIYGISRVQIGQGRIRGDGSVGAWAAKGVQEYGVVSRTVQLNGKYDLREYSESRCREWGNKGAPSDLEPVGKKSLVRGISQVRTADEAIKALAQGYPIAVCSNQGFSSTRDAEGFLRASGNWGHCMAVIGYKGGKRPGFLFQNSWGPKWLTGPMGSEEIPEGSFWADKSVADRMFKAGDSWAFSDAVGFPGKKIDWFVLNGDNKNANKIDGIAGLFRLRPERSAMLRDWEVVK